MKNLKQIYIHALVILAVVMAGISPACAFISGNSSVIQICAPDGSVQNIEVDASFDPFAEKMPLSEHLEAMEQCSYCFNMDHAKAYDFSQQDLIFKALPRYVFVSSGTALPLGQDFNFYQSRGPPQFS